MSARRIRNVRANSFTSGRTPSPPSSTMSDPPKSTSPFSLAQPATSGGSGGIFGQPASGAPKQGGVLFGSSANPPATQAPNPFSNTSTAGGNSSVFGGGGSNLFGGASKPSTGSNFGQAQSNNTSGELFGSGQPGSQNNQPSSSAPFSTAFSAFSTPNKSSDQPASRQSQATNLFGGGAGGSTTPSFSFSNLGSAPGQTTSTTPTSKPATNLFGNSTTPAGPPPSNNSGAGSGSVLFGKPPQDASYPFGNLGTSSSAQGGNSTAAQSSPFRGFTLGASKPQETPVATSATQTPSLFGSTPNAGASNFFGGNKRAAQSDGGLFTNLNKTQDAGANKSATSQQPQSEAPNPSLFNLDGQQPTATSAAPKPADPTATSQAPAQPAATGAAQGTGTAAANLGASVAGPAPPAQSRLKNKSMDDIITRWASDLSKYQKEFQQQAEKVATWDRMLVENSEKIQKLYGSTLEAERATTEVERQLTAVENDQVELSMWLDHYEKEVDSMISSSVGQGDTLSGPDQERERT